MPEEGSPSFLFIGVRRNTDTITETGYTIFLSATFVGWILLLLIARFRFSVKISDADNYTYAAVAAGLGAIALGILAVVHEANAGQRFLKIALGNLTFIFVSSCLCAILSITQFIKDSEVHPRVTLYLTFAFSLVFIASLSGRLLKMKIYVFSPLLTPILPLITTSDHVLPVTAFLMLAGGTIGLVALTAIFAVCMPRQQEQPSEADQLISLELERRQRIESDRKGLEQLKETIVDILRSHHAHHSETGFFKSVDQSSFLSSSKIFLSRQEIVEKLKAQKIFVGENLIFSAISQLESEYTRVFQEKSNGRSGGYYIAPSVDELSKVEAIFDRLALVDIRYERQKHDLLFDAFAIYLSSQVNYPAKVLEDRLAPSINTRLDDTKRFKSADWGEMSFSPGKGKLYLSLNQGLDRVCIWLHDEISAHKQKIDLSVDHRKLLVDQLERREVFPPDLKQKIIANDAEGKELREALASMFR
jgi:hypothetical protein